MSQPEQLRKLKAEEPHEFEFRRSIAEAGYNQAMAENDPVVAQYMKELMEFYDGI